MYKRQPETAAAAASVMKTEGTPISDARASAAYRSAMLEQSLLKFFASTRQEAVSYTHLDVYKRQTQSGLFVAPPVRTDVVQTLPWSKARHV